MSRLHRLSDQSLVQADRTIGQAPGSRARSLAMALSAIERKPADMITAGTRVISANGNLGTVVGNMTKDGSIVAIKLDNGRQISCLATLCKPIR